MDTINEDFFYIEIQQPSPPEFRLYYDDQGKVVCYTCDKLEGKYIVIDKETYVECRPDLLIVDGEIKRDKTGTYTTKLELSSKGTMTAVEDICIVVDDNYTGKTNNWELVTHDF
jgi:hypothetical protein